MIGVSGYIETTDCVIVPVGLRECPLKLRILAFLDEPLLLYKLLLLLDELPMLRFQCELSSSMPGLQDGLWMQTQDWPGLATEMMMAMLLTMFLLAVSSLAWYLEVSTKWHFRRAVMLSGLYH